MLMKIKIIRFYMLKRISPKVIRSIWNGFALLARAWRERRAENHGDHRGPFVSARILPRQLSCPFLGCDLLSGGYGSRHPSRRLADCPNHGIKDYSAESHARVLRGIRRRNDPFCCDVVGHPRVDDSYDYGIDCWCRSSTSNLRCPVGIASNIIVAWLLTLPATALVAGTVYFATRLAIPS